MREEQIFAKTLEELSALAKEQGNMLSEEQVTEAFDKAESGRTAAGDDFCLSQK